MTRRQNSAKQMDWKAMMAEQQDFLRPLIQEVLQQVMEAEMDEALGAEKGERTSNRVGYRSGYYGRTLVTRVGKLGSPPGLSHASTLAAQVVSLSSQPSRAIGCLSEGVV
jgi:hypothetical protein